jgi:hypothetical protein
MKVVQNVPGSAKMKISILSCAVIAAAMTDLHAATLVSATLTMSDADTRQCEQNECTSFGKGSLTLTHVIEISEAEALYLDESTTVSISFGKGFGVNLRLEDDPDFNTGDKSANIQTTYNVIGELNAPLSAQLNWANGTLSIKIKSKYAGPYTSIPSLTRTEEARETKDPNGQTVNVAVTHPSLGEFGTQTLVAGDSKVTSTEFVSANGDLRRKSLANFKSRKAAP